MADERVTLLGLAGRVRDLVVFGSGDHATGMERVRDNIQEQLEDLADSGHFIARRLEPGEVPDSLDENYLCVHERGNVTIHTGRGVRMNSDRVKYAIPLADLAPEGE